MSNVGVGVTGVSAISNSSFSAWRARAARAVDAYLDWCRSEGRKYTATKEQFGRDLRAVAVINRKQRRCKLTGKAKPVYAGVRLLPA